MAEHDRFGFDAANSPAEDAQPIDHRRVAIGAHQCVCEPTTVFLTGDIGNPLEIYLVDNPSPRGDGTESFKTLLTPFEEFITLHISLVFNFQISLLGIGENTGVIHLHAVVDDQVNRNLGIDLFRISTQGHHRIAESGDIDHRGNSGEILKKYP